MIRRTKGQVFSNINHNLVSQAYTTKLKEQIINDKIGTFHLTEWGIIVRRSKLQIISYISPLRRQEQRR